jgi:hypothetical protein
LERDEDVRNWTIKEQLNENLRESKETRDSLDRMLDEVIRVRKQNLNNR